MWARRLHRGLDDDIAADAMDTRDSSTSPTAEVGRSWDCPSGIYSLARWNSGLVDDHAVVLVTASRSRFLPPNPPRLVPRIACSSQSSRSQNSHEGDHIVVHDAEDTAANDL